MFVVTDQVRVSNRDNVQVDVCHSSQVFRHETECHWTLSTVVQHFTTSWTVTAADERRQATNGVTRCLWHVKLIVIVRAAVWW